MPICTALGWLIKMIQNILCALMQRAQVMKVMGLSRPGQVRYCCLNVLMRVVVIIYQAVAAFQILMEKVGEGEDDGNDDTV